MPVSCHAVAGIGLRACAEASKPWCSGLRNRRRTVFADDDVDEPRASARSLPGLMARWRSASAAVRFCTGSITYQLGAVAAGFDDEGPQVNVGAVDVRAPGDDEFSSGGTVRARCRSARQRGDEAGAAGGGANGAVEARGAQAVEEAAVHAGAVEQAHGAGVAVREDRFGAELLAIAASRPAMCRELRPRKCVRSGLAFGADASHGIEQAVGEYSRSRYCATLPHRKPRVTGWSGSPRSFERGRLRR